MFLRLRDLREDRDLTQADMAAQLGCAQQTYSRHKSGKAQMSYGTLSALADYFATSVDYLLGRTDEQAPYPPAKRT
ncbi:helix-turn-helix domain-containing protein [uncultured Oscillibacter sp.]|uniref:helix-turn-helix domain-containing protein n=1 Tax=uncultured Oscillibacter sp. TaxID=876091 RepID=UPI0025DF6DC6|nr:helix-turn-helix transcriptional regulator [uncultured Oscillibacter sp.]